MWVNVGAKVTTCTWGIVCVVSMLLFMECSLPSLNSHMMREKLMFVASVSSQRRLSYYTMIVEIVFGEWSMGEGGGIIDIGP